MEPFVKVRHIVKCGKLAAQGECMVKPFKFISQVISGRRAEVSGRNRSSESQSAHSPAAPTLAATHDMNGSACTSWGYDGQKQSRPDNQPRAKSKQSAREASLRQKVKAPETTSSGDVKPVNLDEVRAAVGAKIKTHFGSSASKEVVDLQKRLDALNDHNRPVENGKPVSLDRWESLLKQRLVALKRES